VNKSLLYNILGRLSHDTGDFKEAIDSYTSALLLKPTDAAIFRNLGSAYHADSNLQMSFASYQQALTLDPTNILVYLKLAYFYEDLAGKDWDSSLENAIKCYQYYLDKEDSEDTSVLIRLGNLLIRGNAPKEALEVYKKASSLDDSLEEPVFNSVHAHLKLNEDDDARLCLEKTLERNPNNAAAKHMLMVLNIMYIYNYIYYVNIVSIRMKLCVYVYLYCKKILC
jgi:tetratricopeptide (TPR) repeat protein